jgi:hypothetical protein
MMQGETVNAELSLLKCQQHAGYICISRRQLTANRD